MTEIGGILGVAQYSTYIYETEPLPKLEIKYKFPIGLGIITDKNSALIRPFNKILNDGKLPGKVVYLFHKDNDEYYILGSFACTEKHLIFFPGVVDRKLVNFYEKELLKNGITTHLNHFTLDNNLRTWHVSTDEKQSHGITFKTLQIRETDSITFLWFVLRVRNSTDLELASEEIEISYSSTLKKLKKLSEIITKSIKYSEFPCTKVEDDTKTGFFWQFEFFVTSTIKLRSVDAPVTIQKNIDVTINDARKNSPVGIYMVKIDGFPGSVLVRVSKIRGTISTPCQFISGHEIKYSS